MEYLLRSKLVFLQTAFAFIRKTEFFKLDPDSNTHPNNGYIYIKYS